MMDTNTIAASVLSSVNDQLTVVEYGHGFLVTMPMTFYDNDQVTLFVEPFENGVRVSDRGTTAMRLHGADLNIETERIRVAWNRSLAASSLFNPANDEFLIADFGSNADLAKMLLKVANASLRIDQLRWLASERRSPRFSDRVVTKLFGAVSNPDAVLPHAQLPLRSGRTRQVTASVGYENTEKVFVQALGGTGGETRERAVEHCYHLFNLAKDLPKSKRLAFAAGKREDWPPYVISELDDVCEIAFDEQQDEKWLRQFLDERTSVSA